VSTTSGESLPDRPGKERKRSSRVVIVAVVLVAVLIVGAVAWLAVQIVNNKSEYTAHDPIRIDGNGGFTNASGVVWGSGTESDPYIIEGWDISASTTYGIDIANTDAHFIVRNCYVHGGGLNYPGIFLGYCTNGILDCNKCSNNHEGILLYSSSENIVSHNTCSSHQSVGIEIEYSSNDNTISNNTCQGNFYGIHVYMSSDGNTLENNTCSNNQYGIEIAYTADGNTISNNICNLNDRNGIFFFMNGNNNMFGNQACNNTGHGVYIDSGFYNRIWNNTFINNHGTTDTYDPSHVQACDNTTSNWWSSLDGYGNYWSDWTGPDANMDGIVDVPYALDGSAGAKDYYPLATP